MTAGRGIMREEMPPVRPEGIDGFQLWVNLPAKLKMSGLRYQDIGSREIPELQRENGVRIRVITGRMEGISGPVTDLQPTRSIWMCVFLCGMGADSKREKENGL